LNETEQSTNWGEHPATESERQPGYEALSSIIDFSYLIADDRNGSGGMIDEYKNGNTKQKSKSSLLAK